jgi:LmbE family N-acetylglucosaminyl deacetylase
VNHLRVLGIGAHPDDIEFGCFGTLARLSKGHSVHIIVLSQGELGGSKKARMEECRQSASLINADLRFLDYEDGDISVNANSVLELRNCVQSIDPSIVFTLCPQDTHQDHRHTSQITISACRNVDEILFYEVPSTVNFCPNVFYDITDFFLLKESALSSHLSQNSKAYMDLRALEGLARAHAYHCGHKDRLFEAFQSYRTIR